MLELRNIVKVYQGGTVNETCLFNDFSLSIPDKQFVCVVGSNGSGKTSVVKTESDSKTLAHIDKNLCFLTVYPPTDMI